MVKYTHYIIVLLEGNGLVTYGALVLFSLLAIGFIRAKGYVSLYMYLLKVMILFSIYIQIGYVIDLVSYQVEYSEFLMVVSLIFGIPLIIKNTKLKLSSTFLFFTLMLTVLIGYWLLLNADYSELVLPVGGSWDRVVFGTEVLQEVAFSSSHILRFIRLMMFISLYLLLDKLFLKDQEKKDTIKKFIVNSGVVMVIICLIEQFTKGIMGSTIFVDFTSNVFGIAESQVTINFQRGGMFALQGLALEPGSLSTSFIPAVLILLTSNLFTGKRRTIYLLSFMYVMISSGSFAGFALSSLFFFWFLFSDKKQVVRKLIIIGLISFIGVIYVMSNESLMVIVDYYSLRVQSLLQGGGMGSERPRMLSITTAMDTFYRHPFFGVGFGSTDVFGLIPTLLASVGAFGTIFWAVTLLKGAETSRVTNKAILFTLIPFMFFVGSLRMIYSIDIMLLFLLVFRESREIITMHSKRDIRFQ